LSAVIDQISGNLGNIQADMTPEFFFTARDAILEHLATEREDSIEVERVNRTRRRVEMGLLHPLVFRRIVNRL